MAKTASLYVDGRLAETVAGVTVPAESGELQIGREDTGGGNWHGVLAAVRLWGRVVVADEIAAAAKRSTLSKGYWELDAAADGSRPERDAAAR
ncbi:LamG-like jellyroll fold domain-containing protein [Streptomyces sp. NPDC002845]